MAIAKKKKVVPAWAARLRKARKAAGYSQVTLAKKLKIGQGQVSRWERGLHVLSPRYAMKLSSLFSVPVYEITPAGPDEETYLSLEKRLADLAATVIGLRRSLDELLQRLRDVEDHLRGQSPQRALRPEEKAVRPLAEDEG